MTRHLQSHPARSRARASAPWVGGRISTATTKMRLTGCSKSMADMKVKKASMMDRTTTTITTGTIKICVRDVGMIGMAMAMGVRHLI